MSEVAILSDCPVCDDALDDEVLQSYLHAGPDPESLGGVDMARRGNAGLGQLGKFLPPDVVPTLKTAAIGGVSLFASRKLAERLVPMIVKKTKDADGAEVELTSYAQLPESTRRLWEGGLALLTGGAIWQLAKKRDMATAWSIAPAALALFTMIDKAMPAGETAGYRGLATIVPSGGAAEVLPSSPIQSIPTPSFAGAPFAGNAMAGMASMGMTG